MTAREIRNIKAIAMDVDGVLTDGTFWWGPNGEEFKRFCFADSTGISLALKSGLKVALISGESSDAGKTLVQRYADKLKISDVFKGCHDKKAAVEAFARKHDLTLLDICYIGDDLIDTEAMSIVGFAVCPSDAHRSAKSNAQLITSKKGGRGAVREVVDLLLSDSAGD